MNLDLEQSFVPKYKKQSPALFNQPVDQLQLQPTNPEFEGSHTLVCFPLTRISKLKPEETANAVGNYLVEHSGVVSRFNVVKGFLNLVITDKVWAEVFAAIYANKNYGLFRPTEGRS
jgi:arginyl-tRNA synthetase